MWLFAKPLDLKPYPKSKTQEEKYKERTEQHVYLLKRKLQTLACPANWFTT